MQDNKPEFIYTEEQLMARLKFFIGICLALTLTGIVFVVLYSIIFVTQPLNAMSPIDQKFFELIIPIATFLTGTLSGIMLAGGDKEAQRKALEAANKGWDKPVSPPQQQMTTTTVTRSFGNSPMGGMQSTGMAFTGGLNGTSAGDFNGMFTPQVIVGFNGKPAPLQPPQPEL